jgi:hypothetical protein
MGQPADPVGEGGEVGDFLLPLHILTPYFAIHENNNEKMRKRTRE